ncbi:glycosyltransferase [Microbacterium lacticum]|uniref:glycosyltransferase n=1 Tax=Microbacterium lacticum TaxID=33885 RepID=UPI001F5AA73F|nr:glycosyltransferase [Microbacterium lacticum]
MSTSPLVSIVIPVFNDQDTISSALDSCLAQSMSEIEVICVDDASSDASVEVIERYVRADVRVRLVRQEKNLSAFQARRAGVFAARGEYLLFLDGDDGLAASTARVAHKKASSEGSDLVGFGVRILRPDGSSGGSFEGRLQPRHQSLDGSRVLSGIFPKDQPASGQIWRYMFRTQLLRDAYSLLPDDLVLPRANDVPIMFLAAALAGSYSSVSDQLYNYHFGAGRSGQRVEDLAQAQFYASAISSIDSIVDAVGEIARNSPDPGLILDSYESVRLSIIGHTCKYFVRNTDEHLLGAVLGTVANHASFIDMLVATARFAPETLPALKAMSEHVDLGNKPVRSILLTTMTLRTGGVSAVLLAQARIFLAAGYKVTILARREGSDRSAVPSDAVFVELSKGDRAAKLAEWAAICRAYEVDVVIDHQILYTRDWPEYAVAARTAGAATIGWIHNFAGRPIYDLKDLHSLMQRDLHLLAELVVLSPLDVSFWKLRGIAHTVYLPNPPSPLLLDLAGEKIDKQAPGAGSPLELVWWGRLEQRTKQVLQLIEVASELKKRNVPFHLSVIGPEWEDLSINEFNAVAKRLGLEREVEAIGPRHGHALVDAIDAADAFISTSVIEGYQLTIAEAQARGLPVFMYELPWLTLVQENEGIVAVPQGDASALASRIAEVLHDPEAYSALSRASVAAAERALSHDFGDLYQQLVNGTLPDTFSPEPTLADAQKLIDLLIFYSERNAGLLQKRPTPDGATASARKKSSGSRKPSAKSKSAPTARTVTADLSKQSVTAFAWGVAKPVGRRVLLAFPSLRPVAHRVKKRLLSS